MKTTVNKVIRGKISKEDLIYIAGLFDGEGHIFITEDKRPAYKTSLHILRTGITNTNREVIEWVYSLFPATWEMRIRNKNHPHWKPCFFWEASSNKALYFIKMIYPYLRIKKEQARLAIEFQEKWQDRRYLNNRNTKGQIKKTSSKIYKKRQWYKEKIGLLNIKKSPTETKRSNT